MFKGIAASRGIGIGNACIIKDPGLKFDSVTVTDIEAEKKRLINAVQAFTEETNVLADKLKEKVGPKEAEILKSHLDIVSDPVMTEEVGILIASGYCAETAVETVCDKFCDSIAQVDDEFMQQRVLDIEDVKFRLLEILLGRKDEELKNLPEGTVLVAKDLTPSVVSQINKDNVVGIITEMGGFTSHTAIIARALGIPAVLSLEGITSLVRENDQMIVDGIEGKVFIKPDSRCLSQYVDKQKEYAKEQAELNSFLEKEAVTADGDRLKLLCNVGTPEEVKKAMDINADGIGLFRSEFLYMGDGHILTEEEQFKAYKKAVSSAGGKPVVIRTFDVGGDKQLPGLGLKREENPFLGLRAVRYCLAHPDSFNEQLRAIIRASAFGKVKIMIPFISCAEELKTVRRMISDIMKELSMDGAEFDKNIQVGCMIETPAAVMIADILAKEADFFSIGTNDLTQYVLSVDRGNRDVAYLYSPFHPSVLRMIKHVIDCGKKAGIPVAMCGEAASHPRMLPILISFGLDEYSVDPSMLLSTRRIMSKWSRKDADELTQKVMALDTKEEIMELLSKYRST